MLIMTRPNVCSGSSLVLTEFLQSGEILIGGNTLLTVNIEEIMSSLTLRTKTHGEGKMVGSGKYVRIQHVISPKGYKQ